MGCNEFVEDAVGRSTTRRTSERFFSLERVERCLPAGTVGHGVEISAVIDFSQGPAKKTCTCPPIATVENLQSGVRMTLVQSAERLVLVERESRR